MFISADLVSLRHICEVKNLRTGYHLPILVNDRVITLFPEDLIFKKPQENKNFAKISEFTVYHEECSDIFGRVLNLESNCS